MSVESISHVPLFPLPDTVLFPQLLLPLHVFEERYRAMVDDALADDRRIAMAVLRPGWESSYDTKRPELHPAVCVGNIVAEQRLADGRYHLVLRGTQRARLLDEEETDHPYRVGVLQAVDEIYPDPAATDRELQRSRLLAAFRDHLDAQIEHVLHGATDERVPLGVLCDALTFALNMPPEDKLALLAEANVDQRVLMLQRWLADTDETRPFPPRFSEN